MKHKAGIPLFITGTDTGVGKTMATLVLATLLQARGQKVGIMKPVQCSGNDAQFLKKQLKIKEDLRVINPFYAPEPLSPHLAFRRAGIRFDRKKIQAGIKRMQECYDVVLIEGAGGLMVPLTLRYDNADLIRDLKAETIIISRRSLGTINHTLLTVRQAQAYGLRIKGILFSDASPGMKGLPEQTNPAEIQKLSGVKVLGIVPYLKSLSAQNILDRCQTLDI